MHPRAGALNQRASSLAAGRPGRRFRVESHKPIELKWFRQDRPGLRLLTGLLVASLASGCLSNTYEIPHDEVQRLTRTPPAERGQKVRAVQRFETSRQPPDAAPWPRPPAEAGPPPQGAPGVVYYPVPHLYLGWGSPYYAPAYRSPYYEDRLYGPGTLYGAPSSGPLSPAKSQAKADRDSIVGYMAAALVIAAAVGVGLAVSEGARYDGYVAVHPHHPVHILRPDDQHSQVALDELRADQVGPHDIVVLRGTEGTGMWLRGRAPLSRQGVAYRFGFGYFNVPLRQGYVPAAGGGEVGLGYFPTQWGGVLANVGLAYGENFDGDYLSLRTGLEGQWYPIQLWRVHLGGFLGGGSDLTKAGGGELPETDKSAPYVDFGGLLEVDLTTRLAFTFRYGMHWLPTSEELRDDMVPWLTLGLTVY